MKAFPKSLLLLLPFAFVACTHSSSERNTQNNTAIPQANEANDLSSFSKREAEYILEQTYANLIKKDTALLQLDEAINSLIKAKDDSLNTFYAYQDISLQYYAAAQLLANQFKDTVLRKKAENRISGSQWNYQLLVQKHRHLDSQISINDNRIKDLYALLKLTKTLEEIERFQKSNFPSYTPMQEYISAQKTLMDQLPK